MPSRLLLTVSAPGDDPMWMTALWGPKYNAQGDFPYVGPFTAIQLDNNTFYYEDDGQTTPYKTGTRPIAVWDGSSTVYVSLSHLDGRFPGPTLATLSTTGQLGTFRWVTDYQWGEIATSVVFVQQEPFYAWMLAGKNPDGNLARVSIACHATDWDSTGNWNWTSNEMPRTDQGSTLLSVNSGTLVYHALINTAGDNTLHLYTQTPQLIKEGIYQASSRAINWNTFQHVPSNRSFYGKPAMVTSGITNLKLHVFMMTDSNDPSPNQIYYFWVPIRPEDSNPQYTGNNDLAVQDAGLIPLGNAEPPRGQIAAVQWGPEGDDPNEWLFVFYQNISGYITVFKKLMSDSSSTWQQGQYGQGTGVGMAGFGLNRGGIAACLVPDWYGPR